MYNRVAQVRATVTHLDLYYELERVVGRELWTSIGHESLEAIIKLTYERTQASKRGVSLSQRIYETVDKLSHKLIDEINPLVDEIQEVNAFWMDDRKSAVWTLSVPDSVIGRLNVSWDVEEQRKMAAEEAADDGSHN